MATDSDSDTSLEFETGIIEHRSVWSLAAGLLGISLWAQLFWYPLATEFLARATGAIFVGLYLLPVVVLAGSLLLRNAAGLLFGLPVALLPGLVLVPGQDAAALLQLHRGLPIAGTILAYLAVAAIATRPTDIDPNEQAALEGADPESVDGLYRHYISIRLVILVGLFGVLVGAVIFDPTLRKLVADHHGQGRVAAQVFIGVLGFFVWCVVAYTMFFLPLANIEYDLRSLSREIDAMAKESGGIRWRLGIAAAVAVGGTAGWLFWGAMGF